jgi:hypothetical protein
MLLALRLESARKHPQGLARPCSAAKRELATGGVAAFVTRVSELAHRGVAEPDLGRFGERPPQFEFQVDPFVPDGIPKGEG